MAATVPTKAETYEGVVKTVPTTEVTAGFAPYPGGGGAPYVVTTETGTTDAAILSIASRTVADARGTEAGTTGEPTHSGYASAEPSFLPGLGEAPTNTGARPESGEASSDAVTEEHPCIRLGSTRIGGAIPGTLQGRNLNDLISGLG